jgi:hypothetical protein
LDNTIKTVLLKRFPKATEDEIRIAHGYTYGGCIIQDLGYYPFGSRFFSDLVHYVDHPAQLQLRGIAGTACQHLSNETISEIYAESSGDAFAPNRLTGSLARRGATPQLVEEVH